MERTGGYDGGRATLPVVATGLTVGRAAGSTPMSSSSLGNVESILLNFTILIFFSEDIFHAGT